MAMDATRLERVRAEWAGRGFSCELWVDGPGQRWIDFVHEVDELVMLLEGEIELTFQGRALRPQPGEEVLIPAHVRHDVVNVGGSVARWLFGYQCGYAGGS